MSRIKGAFDLLDQWRHLPAYQLERRVDIFFALYLPEIIAHKFSLDTKIIIPEFPIRVGEIYDDVLINKSFKVDYLVVTGKRNHFVFVELKTDANSIRPKQNSYLVKARSAGMRKLISGIIKICDATQQKKKYGTLMRLLNAAGLVEIADNRYKNLASDGAQIEVLYIQPGTANNDFKTILFSELAEIVGKHNDEVSQRFAKSIRAWEEPPGEAG